MLAHLLRGDFAVVSVKAPPACQDSSLWPYSSPWDRSSRPSPYTRAGITRYGTLRSPDFPLRAAQRSKTPVLPTRSGCLARFAPLYYSRRGEWFPAGGHGISIKVDAGIPAGAWKEGSHADAA